jgi:non-specific protein-tyrosine kinase
MELLVYLRILRRRLFLLAAIVLAGTVSAVLFSLQQHPLFTTTTTLLLNPASPSELVLPGAAATSGTEQTPTVDRLARSYAEYLRTRAFGTIVVERLGLAATPEDVALSTTAALVPGTNFFRVSVTWDTRLDAQRIANGVAQIFIEENRRMQLNSRPSVSATVDLTDSLAYYERRVKALRAERDEIENTPRLSDKERRERLSELETRLQAIEDTYIKLLSNTAATQASQERLLNTATIVDPAPLPGFPSQPNRKQNVVLAAIGSAAVGAGIAILLEYLDSTVKTARDVEQLLGHGPAGIISQVADASRAPGLLPAWLAALRLGGLFPFLARRKQGQPPGQAAAPGNASPQALVTARATQNPVAEAFRTLRANLQLAAVDQRLRTVLVTSLTPGEGKSFVAANLASVFAQAGKRVILVDADLRRPTQHRLLGLTNDVGLTTLMLADDPAPETALQLTSVPGLALLASGPLPPNPSELLGSARMTHILDRLATIGDLVILDSPPIMPV